MSPEGFEPSTNGLKGRCSTTELRAHTGDLRYLTQSTQYSHSRFFCQAKGR